MRAILAAILEHWQLEISVEKELFNAQFAHMIIHNPSDTRGSDMIAFCLQLRWASISKSF
jgi:hypothetical protein